MTNNTDSIERDIRGKNESVRMSLNGKEARKPMADSFSLIADLVKGSDYSYYENVVNTGEVKTLLERFQEDAEDAELMANRMGNYKSQATDMAKEVVRLYNLLPQTEKAVQMALSDQNDQIIMDQNGNPIETEFTAFFSS